jgi:hypothetical protein
MPGPHPDMNGLVAAIYCYSSIEEKVNPRLLMYFSTAGVKLLGPSFQLTSKYATGFLHYGETMLPSMICMVTNPASFMIIGGTGVFNGIQQRKSSASRSLTEKEMVEFARNFAT